MAIIMRIKALFTTLLLLASLSVFAQSLPAQPDEAKRAEIREKIDLDMTVPDFETRKIDASVMDNRLAGILEYLMENYQQGVQERRLIAIAGEQNKLDNGRNRYCTY